MSVLPIVDSTVKINTTPALVTFVKTKLEVKEDSPENIIKIKKSSKNNMEDCVLHIKDIKWLNEKLIEYRKTSENKIYLNHLLDKTNIILPQPEVVPRNPELDARVKKLFFQEKEREYAAITKNIDNSRKRHPEDTIAYQIKQLNRQLIAIAQVVISAMTGFLFGYKGIELFTGDIEFGFRLMLGIIIASIVIVAEIYWLAKRLNEEYKYETTTKPTFAKIHQE